jgi:MFS family permease
MADNAAVKAQKRNMIFIPIMAIFALGASQGGVNAALQTMGQVFPSAGAGIAYVISIVALGMIPASAITGLVTGRYIKYKTSIIIGIICYLISGCLPAVMGASLSFPGLLVSRFIFGFAVGWSYPQGNALAFKTYHEEQKRARVMGSGMAFMNIGTLVMEFAAGYLALVSWQMAFWVYILGVIPLLAVIVFLKEPENDLQQARELAAKTKSETKTKIPLICWPYMIIFALIVTFLMPTILYGSYAVMQIAGPVVGNSGTTGIIMSVMTVVGALSGFIMGPIYKKLGKWTTPIAAAWVGIFYVLCAVFTNYVPSFVGYVLCFLVGHWGFATVIPGTANILSNLSPVGAATKTMGWNTVFHQLGCFLPAPVAQLVLTIMGTDPNNVLAVLMPCSIIELILTVIYFILVGCTKMDKVKISSEALDEEK